MRAEVESESGARSRPLSRSDMYRATSPGPQGNGGVPEDDQAEWARQEQQVRMTVYLMFLRS